VNATGDPVLAKLLTAPGTVGYADGIPGKLGNDAGVTTKCVAGKPVTVIDSVVPVPLELLAVIVSGPAVFNTATNVPCPFTKLLLAGNPPVATA
jgi:hypothetical protein